MNKMMWEENSQMNAYNIVTFISFVIIPKLILRFMFNNCNKNDLAHRQGIIIQMLYYHQ